MSGTIAVVASDTGRYTNFSTSLARLEKPEGWEISVLTGSDTIQGRNAHVEEMQGDWIWFIDDDHEFAPFTLKRLLAREVDVIVPLCLMRSKPFNPVDFVGLDGDLLMPLDLRSSGRSGTKELFAAGTSGMLIHKKVFDQYRDHFPGAPYFEHGERSEDIIFCERLREMGIKIHVDLEVRIGHLNVVSVYPDVAADGSWCIGMRVGPNFPIQIGIEAGNK